MRGDRVKKYQFVNWFPEWQGFIFWKYPRPWNTPMFYGVTFFFWEIRYFPKRLAHK